MEESQFYNLALTTAHTSKRSNALCAATTVPTIGLTTMGAHTKALYVTPKAPAVAAPSFSVEMNEDWDSGTGKAVFGPIVSTYFKPTTSYTGRRSSN